LAQIELSTGLTKSQEAHLPEDLPELPPRSIRYICPVSIALGSLSSIFPASSTSNSGFTEIDDIILHECSCDMYRPDSPDIQQARAEEKTLPNQLDMPAILSDSA
jgi:hypothetical protein